MHLVRLVHLVRNAHKEVLQFLNIKQAAVHVPVGWGPHLKLPWVGSPFMFKSLLAAFSSLWVVGLRTPVPYSVGLCTIAAYFITANEGDRLPKGGHSLF